MEKPTKNLADFYEELQALLKKYDVALDFQGMIVAVDLSRKKKEIDLKS